MASIGNLSEFINSATGGSSGAPEFISAWKNGRVAGAAAAAQAAGRWTSLWQYEGNPCAGAAPAAAAVPTRATNGALGQTDPTGGRTKWMTYLGGGCLNQGRVKVLDRLLAAGGLSGTVTTPQTVGGTLTRNTGGVGNRIYVEISTQVGATPTTITASYTNQAGVSGRTTVAAPFGNTNNREAQRWIELPLQSGDTGVQAVASTTVLSTTGTTGDFAIVVAKPLPTVPMTTIGAGGDVPCLAKGVGPMEIATGACLMMVWLANGTAVPELEVDFFMFER